MSTILQDLDPPVYVRVRVAGVERYKTSFLALDPDRETCSHLTFYCV
jgi:hypothetical protein